MASDGTPQVWQQSLASFVTVSLAQASTLRMALLFGSLTEISGSHLMEFPKR